MALRAGAEESRGNPLIIDQVLVGRLSVFSYLITDPVSREALLLDPASEVEKVFERATERASRIRWIVCTHAHADHIGGVAAAKRISKAQFGIHESEARNLNRLTTKVLVRVLGGSPPPDADFTLRDGDKLSLGSRQVRILHTPGHSPGSICLQLEGDLLTGDTLFVGGVGRTDLPGSSPMELARSVSQKILCLPADTRIWPGHHYGASPWSTLGAEIEHNPFVREMLRQSGGNVARSGSLE